MDFKKNIRYRVVADSGAVGISHTKEEYADLKFDVGLMTQSAARIDLLIYDSIQQFFVLTNYFKCSFKNTMNNHHIPVSKAMKEKCPVILLDEIVCLRPDVVVVQGKFTNATFWNGLKGLNKHGCEDSFTCEKTSVTKYCYTDGAPFFVIWSYHPCAPGRKWYKNLDCLEKSIEFVKKKLVHNEE